MKLVDKFFILTAEKGAVVFQPLPQKVKAVSESHSCGFVS